MAIVVSVFVLFSISQGSFNSECFLWGGGGGGFRHVLCKITIMNNEQVVNRLKIPQSLSTLLFHRWSEVHSRGGVHGDSPYEKLPALQRCHLSVFSECCFFRAFG